MEQPMNVIKEIIDLFSKYGANDYIGETITQTEHMTQAAMFAEEDKADLEVVVAAMLHDIGHLLEIQNKSAQMSNLGVVNHEIVGRDYLLSKGFTVRTANLVGNHVKAKRYLVTKYPDYYEKLSEASKQTLKHQNGLMSKEEMENFESDPLFEDSLKIRGYDDKAKIVGYEVNSVKYCKQLLKSYFNVEKH